MKVGVFDSGVGGRSVANAIQKAFPDAKIVLREDRKNLPYGSKTIDQLRVLTAPFFTELEAAGCDAIVIACNTVSTLLSAELRERSSVPIIALDPMVKPAAERTQTGIIAVCATPATLASERYTELKREFAQGVTVLQPDCSDWSYMIEHDQINHAVITARITEVLEAGADVVVLACTHYHWIEADIAKLAAGQAIILQPEQAIIARLQTVLAPLG